MQVLRHWSLRCGTASRYIRTQNFRKRSIQIGINGSVIRVLRRISLAKRLNLLSTYINPARSARMWRHRVNDRRVNLETRVVLLSLPLWTKHKEYDEGRYETKGDNSSDNSPNNCRCIFGGRIATIGLSGAGRKRGFDAFHASSKDRIESVWNLWKCVSDEFYYPLSKCKYRNILICIGWNLDSFWDVLIEAEG